MRSVRPRARGRVPSERSDVGNPRPRRATRPRARGRVPNGRSDVETPRCGARHARARVGGFQRAFRRGIPHGAATGAPARAWEGVARGRSTWNTRGRGEVAPGYTPAHARAGPSGRLGVEPRGRVEGPCACVDRALWLDALASANPAPLPLSGPCIRRKRKA